VGRPGWLVDDLLAEMRNDADVAKHLVMIHNVDDGLLTALYQAAAFCVYPSAYEGYGLPIIEAFSFGKAVLASSGGALAQLVQGFSPCLDPTDEQAWYETMRKWIETPHSRMPYEQDIRTRLRHPTWSEAAAHIFACILGAKAA
jgi:glycosyltransferase involved in cell wall biosynthesis